MENEALLKNFNELVDRYARHQGYIERARSQRERFSSTVIEKVILDHELQAAEVAESVLPLVPQIEDGLASLDADSAKIESEKGDSGVRMEELELRMAIGELEEGEFEALGGELRGALDDANRRLDALAGNREKLSTALDRWLKLAGAAGQPDGRSGNRSSQTAGQADADVVEEDVPFPEPTPEEDVGVVKNLREDLSEVLISATPAAAPVVQEPDEIEEEIPALDVADEELIADEQSAGADFGFDDVGAGVDLLSRGDGAEVELDLVEDIESPAGSDEIAIDLENSLPGGEPAEAPGEPRRAILLYQEGTAEEQIYPFTGEVLTVGRGRDNDIQIKNDSKVSRFHCKLFRRGNNFYIEDNKSSNGTLVNGELITERRLFGGEEVIIGETFFRFRIL